jgi:hypothetical protein
VICFLLESLADTGRAFGIGGAHDVIPDRWLDEGDQVAVVELVFKVLHALPGKALRISYACDCQKKGAILIESCKMRIFLAGVACVGKTTIGARLADLLSVVVSLTSILRSSASTKHQ